MSDTRLPASIDDVVDVPCLPPRERRFCILLLKRLFTSDILRCCEILRNAIDWKLSMWFDGVWNFARISNIRYLYKPSIIKVRLYSISHFYFNTIAAFGRIIQIIQLHYVYLFTIFCFLFTTVHFIKVYFVRISNLLYIMKRLKLN